MKTNSTLLAASRRDVPPPYSALAQAKLVSEGKTVSAIQLPPSCQMMKDRNAPLSKLCIRSSIQQTRLISDLASLLE